VSASTWYKEQSVMSRLDQSGEEAGRQDGADDLDSDAIDASDAIEVDDFLVDADLQELGQACPARLRLQGDDPGAHGMPGALQWTRRSPTSAARSWC